METQNRTPQKTRFTIVIYRRKRIATVVAYLPTPNGRPITTKIPRRVADELASASVRRRWGNAISLRVGVREVLRLMRYLDTGRLEQFTLDRAIRREFSRVRDLVLERAVEKVGEGLAERYVKAWLKAVDGWLPPDDEDAAAVSASRPTYVVWVYGKYHVQIPPWL
jgi:hypothetical protein